MLRDLSLRIKGSSNNSDDFDFVFKDKPDNVFVFKKEESTDCKNQDWVVLLFEGYSGPDLIIANDLLAIALDNPKISFGFKAYFDVRKLKLFSPEVSSVRAAPILLVKKMNSSNYEVLSSNRQEMKSMNSLLSLFLKKE